MADIQVVQVRPAELGGVHLAFDTLSFAEFGRHRGVTPETCLRVYTRECGVTFLFLDAIRQFLSRITRPQSKSRALLETHAVTRPATASQWFVFHTTKSLLEPIESHDAIQLALATLHAARGLARQGDVVVELVNAATLIDRVWRDLVESASTTKAPPSVAQNPLPPGASLIHPRGAPTTRGVPGA